MRRGSRWRRRWHCIRTMRARSTIWRWSSGARDIPRPRSPISKRWSRSIRNRRDARRELGISYYQQHRADEAIEQFKALQAIDPDDLAAHYNLAILYRRKGMKQAGRT